MGCHCCYDFQPKQKYFHLAAHKRAADVHFFQTELGTVRLKPSAMCRHF